QGGGGGDVREKGRRPYPLLCLSCGEQQRVPAGAALSRREHLERGAVAPQFPDGVDPSEPGRSRDQPSAAAAAGARGGRQRVSFRRPPVRVQGRPQLEKPRPLGQRAKAVDPPPAPQAVAGGRSLHDGRAGRWWARSTMPLRPRSCVSETIEEACSAQRSKALCASHSLAASSVSRNCTSPAASNAIGRP